MGVLLSLQTMDKEKLEAFGETCHDDTLELGMDFLREASATSTLAARYVAMLQRIRTAPTDAAVTTVAEQTPATMTTEPAVGQGQTTHPHHGTPDGIGTSPFTANAGGTWLPRPPDDFQLFGDSGPLDFNDLLFGTGLPRDFLSTDWPPFGLLPE